MAMPGEGRWVRGPRGLLRRLAAPVVFGLGLLAAACADFTFLGYSTAPSYDPNIKTVRVPIFKNRCYVQGIEFDLTREVCHTIAAATPFRVVNGECDPADTELLGTVINLTRPLVLASPVNEQRQAEATLTLEVTWRDLRTGEILSRPSRRPGEPLRPEGPGTPPIIDPFNNPSLLGKNAPVLPATPLPPTSPAIPVKPPDDQAVKQKIILPDGTVQEIVVPPVQIRVTRRYEVELGQSITTAEQELYQKAARQIVHLMEKPW